MLKRGSLRIPTFIKRKIEKMEKFKNVLGFILLPFAYLLFIVDRMFHVLLPHMEHPKFQDFLNTNNVVNATIRIITIGIIRLVLYLFTGV